MLLEGLEDGGWALATKTHHCLVDGVGARDAATVMLDTSPAPPPGARPTAPPPPRDGVLHDLAGLATLPARVGLDGARGLVDLALRDELAAAPHTSLNVPLGEHRRLAVAHVELERVKAIRGALGGTVNDVVLALVTAGLRRLLLARDEIPPARGLRAMVPVNVRAPGNGAELGNQVSSLFVALPVDEPDPEERFRRVHAEAGRRKAGHQAAGGRALIELGALAPPVLHSLVARPVLVTRLFNVTVTNVPGPPRTLYALGRELRAIMPLVPLAAEHAVGVAVTSYAGDLCVCVNADRDLVRDVDEVTAGVEAELAGSRRSRLSPASAVASPASQPGSPTARRRPESPAAGRRGRAATRRSSSSSTCRPFAARRAPRRAGARSPPARGAGGRPRDHSLSRAWTVDRPAEVRDRAPRQQRSS